MNRQEHLLVILNEEGVEVAHRADKTLRFGLDDIEPGKSMRNFEQLHQEICHVLAMAKMLTAEGVLPFLPDYDDPQVAAKIVAVEKWLLHAKQQGTLTP